MRERGRDSESIVAGCKPVKLSGRWAGEFHWEDLVALTVLRQVLKEGRGLWKVGGSVGCERRVILLRARQGTSGLAPKRASIGCQTGFR